MFKTPPGMEASPSQRSTQPTTTYKGKIHPCERSNESDETFREDTELWKKRVAYYKLVDGQLATKGRYRNLLDLNSYLGGFAAVMANDPVWVMNIEHCPCRGKHEHGRGNLRERAVGTYQNWCEAMSTYPRTYDFIHAEEVFALYSGRCDFEDIVLEWDSILRPEGSIIFCDDVHTLVKIKNMFDTMQCESRIVDHELGPLERQKILWANKQYWTAPAQKEGTNTAS